MKMNYLRQAAILATLMLCAVCQSCNAQQTKAEKFINTHESCCGGGCGGNSYKMWKDSLVCYIKTNKAIPYSVKELTDGESLRLFIFISNDKVKRILTVKLKDEGDSRELQGFICEVLSE